MLLWETWVLEAMKILHIHYGQVSFNCRTFESNYYGMEKETKIGHKTYLNLRNKTKTK